MSHSNHTPEGQARSFQGMLRQRDMEFQKLNQENFDLKLKMHHLEERLEKRQSRNRLSATPETDDFYKFDEMTPDSRSSPAVDTHFTANHPMVNLLRTQLSTLRSEKEELTDKLHSVTDDCVAAKARADMLQQEKEGILQSMKIVENERDELACQLDDAQSEGMLFKMQYDQLKEDMECHKSELEAERKKNGTHDGQLRAAMIRSEGVKLQYDATVAAMEEIKREMAVMSKKLGNQARETKRFAALAEERRAAMVASKDECSKAVDKANQLAAEMDAMKLQKVAAEYRLQKEQSRIDILMRSEQEVRKGEWLFSEQVEPLEEMITELSSKNAAFSSRQSYRPEWREEVLEQMNGYLYALHRSQLEVEGRRREFLDKYCAAEMATSGRETGTEAVKLPVLS